MELIFKYCFEVGNFKFGVNENGVFRLPVKIKNRFHPLKKLNKIEIGNEKGYRCFRKKVSEKQIKSLIKPTNISLIMPDKDDLPF